MKNSVFIGLAGLLIGFGAGYFMLGGTSKDMLMSDTKMEMDSSMQGQHMAHPTIEVDATKPVPTVAIEAIKDSKDGYNVHFPTTNYTFTPEKVGGAPMASEGHAHLYVNGTKVARPYSEWQYVASSLLKDGENVIEVTLNANDHSEWTKDGEHIAAQTTVTK